MTKLSILFPGQGSQEKGMGQDVALANSDAMDLWKLAEKQSRLPLREIYWEGKPSDMANTRALQPALTVVNLCLWMAMAAKVRPVATAGHSLGEFSSLAAAGALSIQDAVKATALRGKLMSEAGGPGQGMSAVVKLDQDTVTAIVAQAAKETGAELRVANYNSPGQFVISGRQAALDAAAELTKAQKGRAIPLPVSGAFHSPLIQEAADEFAAYLAGLEWKKPAFAVYHNATALPEPDPDRIMETMQRQMTSSVLWIQTLDAMWLAGVREFVEVGPKGVLFKLLKPNLEGKDEEWTGRNVAALDQI